MGMKRTPAVQLGSRKKGIEIKNYPKKELKTKPVHSPTSSHGQITSRQLSEYDHYYINVLQRAQLDLTQYMTSQDPLWLIQDDDAFKMAF